MTARLFAVPPQLQLSVRARSKFQLSKRDLEDTTSRVVSAQCPTPPDTKHLEADMPLESLESDELWSHLVESMPEGVIVVSQTVRPIYTNSKAKRLCQQLNSEEGQSASLLDVVAEVCRRLLKAEPQHKFLIAEYQGLQGRSVRLRASWLSTNTPRPGLKNNEPHILVLLEDCYETLKENLWIDRQKYDLTDREAEIWMLLRQEYTYQEIAEILQISLNTVKTHVKNVYAKRRSVVGQEKIWYSN